MTPLSVSSLSRTAQLDGVALKTLAKIATSPAPQGPLEHLPESYPLNDCLGQNLLLALGSGGHMDACVLITFFHHVVQLLLLSLLLLSFFCAWNCNHRTTTLSLSVFPSGTHSSYKS